MNLEFSVGLSVISVLLFHVFQKSISGTANPIISVIVTYCTAIIISLIILVIFPPKGGITESFKEVNWASFALGFAIIGIEMGYLLAYRFGLSISLGAIIPPVVVTMVLMFVEFICFKKPIRIINCAGLFFCTIGMIFVNRE